MHIGAVTRQLSLFTLHQDHRHGVRGVGGPGTAVGALHQLGVAMVGGDQQGASHPVGGLHQPTDTAIHGGDRLGGGLHQPRVAHHVGVGVIDHH